MKLFGIIGKPLAGSLSPKLFNVIFKQRNLPYRYLPFQVEKAHLKNLILCMKLTDVEGLNVTAPYKEAVVPHLDLLDASARRAGAVNVIYRRGKKFVGGNTDGEGFCKALGFKLKWKPADKTITLIGAGGAARGLACSLAKAGAQKIYILNRKPKRAKRLASFFKKQFPKTKWFARPLTKSALRRSFPETDLLIQTTPGLKPLPIVLLPAHAIVSDIVTHPKITPLLRQARKKHFKTLDGRRMLLFQAALNLKIWTGLSLKPQSLRRWVR